jgi:hypothetical protein
MMRHILRMTCCLVLLSTPALAQQDTCSRDLFMTDGGLRTSLQKLEAVVNADQAAKCTAWRNHVTVMRKASSVFSRCTSGRERQENVGQMDGSVADFESTIASRCNAPSRTAPREPVRP